MHPFFSKLLKGYEIERIQITKEGVVTREVFPIDRNLDFQAIRDNSNHVEVTPEVKAIAEKIGSAVSLKHIVGALNSKFTEDQIVNGVRLGADDHTPGATIDFSTAAGAANRETSTAQSQSRGSSGWFGGNGPGDGSIAPGTGGGSSGGGTTPTPRSKPSNNNGDRDGNNPGNDNYSGGRNNGSSGSYGNSNTGGGGYDGRGGSSSSSTVGDHEQGTCFAAGTLILLADGSEKPIEEIQLEDEVMSFDSLGVLEARRVIDLIVHDDQHVMNIDGVLVTPNHPFLLPDGSFKPIGDLSVGDAIVRADGALHVIEHISPTDGVQTVYNFTVADLHTYVAAGFRVHNKFAAPVMLDLDGDGLEVTALDRSTVFLDTGGEGFLHRTAWAGEGDGVLYFDPDGRNDITEKRQFVFTEWDPTSTSDLEALASVFDSNGDGVLNASDTDFQKFKVMVTLADGSTVSKTLAELGITEIDLTADASNIELSDGSVITGKTTFTRADGSTGTVGDMLLASEEQGHRVTQVESVDGAGTRSLTTTAYAADGSKAYEIVSEVSADGLSITNRYDDDGDGVIDRIQTIETVVNGDGSRTETERNFSGSNLTTAVLTSREVTTKSADHKVETIERDSMGGGWFDQRETRTEAADGSFTIVVENLAQDGTVITSTSETVSLDGSQRIDGMDADGDGAADTIETHLVDKHADDSRPETVTVTNQDGSLHSKTVEEVEADNRSKVITRDFDGDGQIDQREILDITVTPGGGSTSRLEIRNGDGSLKSASTTVTSDDALNKTTELDRDGDGDIDLTTAETTTVNADGSRERTVTETNGDGSIRAMRKESLDADKVGQEIFVDLDQNGSIEADEKVSSVVIDAATQERTAAQWTRSADGSVLAKTTSITSADGLARTTESDLDGDGDIDLRVSDVTVRNGDGSSSRTVTTKNGDNSLRTIVVTETSADGLTKTVREDVDGDGAFEKKSVNTLELEADGGTTRTSSAYAGDETTLLSETVTTESADRRTRTITLDRDGDGTVDSTTVQVKGTDGAITRTVTEKAADGTVLGEVVSTASANGLVTTTAKDLDGDQVADVTQSSSTTLNADGRKTTVQRTENGDGSLRSTSTVIKSDDGLKIASKTDADGNGTYERIVTDETVLDADGGSTRTIKTRSQTGQLLSRTKIDTSDDGLITVERTDRDGDGSFDVVETSTTVLEADGDTVTTSETLEGGVLRASTTQTVSDNGRSSVTEENVNGDGKTDVRTSLTVADTGVATTLTQSLDTSGGVQSQSRAVASANGLSVTSETDADGNGAYETRSETVRVLNADGSVTTTVSAKAQNGTLQSRLVETVSADGLTTTRTQDFDGDGKTDEASVREAVIAADGTVTTTETVTARNGDLLMKSVETVSGDGRSSTLAIDADGNGINDRVTTKSVGDDGVTTTTVSSYSASGTLISRTTSSESGNGLDRSVSFDLNGNGFAERVLDQTTEIDADGTTTRTARHETGSGRLLAREDVTSSDDGLTVTTALDLDGVGGNDFVSTKTTEFGADGSTLEAWTTHGPGGQKGSATRETSGDGLEVAIEVDLDGDGDIDRSTSVTRNATGGATETSQLYGNGTSLQRSKTTVTSANERQRITTIDQDGDGKPDLRTQTNIDLSGNETTTWKDLAANGSTAEAIITRQANANGTSDLYRLDTDGDGSTDISRSTTVSYDSAGREIRVFEEKEGAAGVLAFKSTTTTSANGLTSTTATDSDGDGEIDTRAETKTVFNADGSTTTTSRDWHEDSGDLRSSYSETISADGRTITEEFDFDGNGVTDKTSVTKTSADGSTVVTETGYGDKGARKRAITTTSSDGLTTTVQRDGVTQTFSHSELGNGSYDWENGKTGADRITVSHKVDATGVETWEMTASTGTRSVRFDAAAKTRLLAEAARIYDAVLDRDMDASEIEVLVKYAAHGQLDLEDLASALLSSGEYKARYGSLTDAGFIAHAYQNTFGREIMLEDLGEHLAALKSGTSRAALIAELAESAEHIVVGNGHGETNNYDVFLIDTVKEDDLRASFGVDGLNIDTDEAKVLVGTNGGNTLTAASGGIVFGQAGNDTLNGTSGSEILVGGKGNDGLRGGTGNDTYLFNRGDGNDIIIDDGSGSNGDTLLFGPGIEIEDLNFARSGDHLVISFYPENTADAQAAEAEGLDQLTGSITIRYWFSDSAKRIERFAFDNGDAYWFGHINSFYSEPGVNINMFRRQGTGNDTFSADPGSDIIVGAEGNDTLYGNDGNDVLLGGEGDDRLYGGAGNDVLDAGDTAGGWQYLYGDAGDDTYLYKRENGKVFINYGEGAGNGSDTVQFTNLNLSDLTFTYHDYTANNPSNPEGIVLGFSWSSGTQSGELRIAQKGQHIERIEFADGSVYSRLVWREDGRVQLEGTTGNDLVIGTDFDDFLTGGSGDDVLDVGAGNGSWQHTRGGAGNDTYLIGKNSGNTVVHEASDAGMDTLQFKDLQLSDLTFSYLDTSNYGRALLLTWNKDGESGKVQVSNGGADIERIEFADGSVYSRLVWREDGRLELHGTDGSEVMVGTGHDDFLFGGDGNDVLDVGAGNGSWQHARGQMGDDTYLIGTDSGSTTVHEGPDAGTDTVRFKDLVLSDLSFSYLDTDPSGSYGRALLLSWNVDGLTGKVQISNEGDDIERIEFADGSVYSRLVWREDGRVQLEGTTGNDLVIGTDFDDFLTGGSGDDVLDVGAGNGSWQHTRGGAGNDTYLIGKNSGNTVVHEASDAGMDTLQFKDLQLSDLTFSYLDTSNYGRALLLTWNKDGESGKVQVSNGGADIERIEFADGSVYSRLVWREDGRLELHGTDGSEVMVGTGHDDFLFGGDGNDVLDVGAGNGSWQHARGQMGDDTYLIGTDSGSTTVHEGPDAGTDTVRFKDLVLSDLSFSYLDTDPSGSYGRALLLSWNVDGLTGKVQISNEGDDIERIEFADGTTLSKIELASDGSVILTGTAGNDVISGTAGNDTLIGGNGADILTGGAGNDTFVFTALNSQIPQAIPADIVTDFAAGAGTDDVLELSSSHFSGFDDVLARATENVADRSVTLNVGLDAPLVVLEDVALADLHQDDFRFV
ncbi:DUF4214 domain-containing protein [Stappia sp. BW2]|uniref:DUF4214 domain-containing protein n=1 Tax=Stappia sp. BW2 TaxID=2592622 RepID=UPI00256FCBB4|nr:DUF4214 domain-containing protein [Stappia sp. BW2]